MNIHHVLFFFCFLSALQDGNTGLVNERSIFAGAEGGSGSVHWHTISSKSTKFFCKGECKEENILVKTDSVFAQEGRYSISCADESSGKVIVTLSFTQLTKSDSGGYRFGLGGSLGPVFQWDFDIIIIDEAMLGSNNRLIRAGIEGGNVEQMCFDTVYGSRKFFCKGECKKEDDILLETEASRAHSGRYSIAYTEGSVYGLSVTIAQLKKSDSGWYKCGYGRALSPSSHSFAIIVVDESFRPSSPEESTGSVSPLAVFVIIIVVLLAVLLLIYKLKMRSY